MSELARSEFREKNQLELNSPDHINQYLRIVSLKVYVLIAALLLLCVSLLVWVFMGHITDKQQICGIVFPSKAVQTVAIPNSGTVTQIYVKTGEHVNIGQALAMVTVDGSTSQLSAPCDGTILDHLDNGKVFTNNQAIFSIVTDTEKHQSTTMIAYASFDVARELRPGMKVQATPTYEPREKIGYVTGTVTSVSNLPVTREEAVEQLKLDDLLSKIMPDDEPGFEVNITLDTNPDMPNGLAWSFRQNTPVSMAVGTFCNIQVITKDRSMYDYLFENVLKESRYVKDLME